MENFNKEKLKFFLSYVIETQKFFQDLNEKSLKIINIIAKSDEILSFFNPVRKETLLNKICNITAENKKKLECSSVNQCSKNQQITQFSVELKLPNEILWKILNFEKSNKQLRQYCGINKRWLSCAGRLLWSKITIFSLDQAYLLSISVQSNFEFRLTKNSSWPQPFLYTKTLTTDTRRKFNQSLITLLSYFSNLKELNLFELDVHDIQQIYKVLPNLTSLCSLFFDFGDQQQINHQQHNLLHFNHQNSNHSLMNQPDSIFHSNFEELKLDLKNLRKIETYCLLGETLQTKAFFSLVNLCENLVDLTIPFPNWESIQILKKNLMKLENLNIVNGEENFAEEEEIHLHEQDENKNFEICLNLILKNSLNLKSFTLNSSKYLTEKNLKLFSEVNFKNLISLELLISNFGLEFKSFKTYLLKFVGGGLVRILLDLRNFLMNDEMLIDFSFYLPKIVHFEIWTSDASSVTLKGAKSLIEKCANLRRIHDCGFSEEVKSYFMKNRVDCRSFMMEVR